MEELSTAKQDEFLSNSNADIVCGLSIVYGGLLYRSDILWSAYESTEPP